MICHSEVSLAIINNLPCSLSRASLAVHLTQSYFQCLENPATVMPPVCCVQVAGGKTMKIFLHSVFFGALMTGFKPGLSSGEDSASCFLISSQIECFCLLLGKMLP